RRRGREDPHPSRRRAAGQRRRARHAAAHLAQPRRRPALGDLLMATTPRADVRFAPPSIGPAEIGEGVAALESGWLSTGTRVTAFERAFADYVGAPHAIALNSCTAALHLSLLASGIGPGDEVVTSPLTFCATANVITHVGAEPRFADIDPRTWNLTAAS